MTSQATHSEELRYPILLTKSQFVRKHIEHFEGEGELGWQVVNRRTNGMLKAGAVVEVRSRPEAKRPKILIDEERYFHWVKNQQIYLDIVLRDEISAMETHA
ncbi:MAG: hypothetical protein NXH95_00705 [Pseudomonadaceae bacterium]|nr:hypothetical protein [Pseudomonadaceae bacterium]